MKKISKWIVDDATKFFIDFALKDENKQEKSKIIAFRRRWLLGDYGLKNKSLFLDWTKRIRKECQSYRHEVKVSEIEVYFDTGEKFLPQPIFSTTIEQRAREEKWGDGLVSVFALELRALGYALKIPAEYDKFLEYYVIYGRKNFKRIKTPGITVSIRYRLNEFHGLIGENVCLTLGQNTGSIDLDNLWNTRVRPNLKSLEARIKDKERMSKNKKLLKEMVERNALEKNWQAEWFDPKTHKKLKETDRDIVAGTKGINELNRMYRNKSPQEVKKLNSSMGKQIQNMRYHRSKKKSTP
ncbi:hypothetical protein B6D29_00755 [Microgenomates bacterium UTCPR1]|jgi:hypothetical protein|nr:MAG: hypothetical protein B6D29_00755 [Microgenomates bacterium UTCPR1]